jgi:hypothetical protein
VRLVLVLLEARLRCLLGLRPRATTVIMFEAKGVFSHEARARALATDVPGAHVVLFSASQTSFAGLTTLIRNQQKSLISRRRPKWAKTVCGGD